MGNNLSFGEKYSPSLSLSYKGTGGGQMDPFVIGSLISAGGGLLGSLLGGDKEKREAKYAYENWKKQYDVKQATAEGKLKPEYKRYSMEKDLPAWDEMLKKLTLGRAEKFMGTNKYGVNFGDMAKLLAGGGGGGVLNPRPEVPMPTNLRGTLGGLGANMTMDKYGLRRNPQEAL